MDLGYRKAVSMSRRAKIVCTLGPATSGQERIAALVAAGLDVARLNMSHGIMHSPGAYRAVRAASGAAGRSVACSLTQLALTWGVETFLVPPVPHTDGMVRQVEAALLEIGRCEKGDKVVIVAGSPPGTPGRTKALRVHCIGDTAES